MTTTSPYVPLRNGAGSSVVHGEVVRVSATNTFTRAQSDSSPHLAGLIGINGSGTIGVGGSANIFTTGALVDVLLETGLTPAAGDAVYVSAAVAGRGTNVPPGTAVQIGVIETAAQYATTGIVQVALKTSGSTGGGGAQGAQGFQGVQGAQGAQGFQGAQGVQGFQGFQGSQGFQGAQGFQGLSQAVANWTIGITRVYAVDFVNGNDSNTGFADPATSSSANYAIACALAGTVARKTLAGIALILPQIGNGRNGELVIANGGVNTSQTYTDNLSVAVGSLYGYAAFDVRGTGTNTNAGCVAFDGSTADCTYLGGITAPGMNTAGYNPTGTPTTQVVQCVKAGGGAPGFGAEPAAPFGFRIRFDSTTTTAALRGICAFIVKVSGTDTLSFPIALPAVPVASDVFYIEQPGVITTGMTISSTGRQTLQLAGLGSTSLIFLNFGAFRTAFTHSVTGHAISNSPNYGGFTSYLHPVLSTITCGGSLTDASYSMTNSVLSLSGVCAVSNIVITNPISLTAVNGVTSGSSLNISNCQQLFVGAGTGTPVFNIGNANAQVVPVRTINGRLALSGGGTISIAQISVNTSTVTGLPLITIDGRWSINLAGPGANTNISGVSTAGVTHGFGAFGGGVAVADTATAGSVIYLDPANPPTITGTLGDVLIANVGSLTWAQVALGYIDAAGITYATPVVYRAVRASGILYGAAGAAFTYLADTGDLALTNITAPLQYPLGAGLTGGSFVIQPRVNTMTQNCTVTLYKNGVATGAVGTILAGSTTVVRAGALVSLVATDYYDLRIDVPAGEATHVLSVSCAILVSNG